MITGASGFLAGYIVPRFAERGWRVFGVDGNPPPSATRDLFAGFNQMRLPDGALDGAVEEARPDLVIHGAGRASVPLSMSDPATDFQSGPVAAFALLDALRRHAPECRFIHLSSAAVYGNPGSLPVAEDAERRPLSPYGFHKRVNEDLCREFAQVYGMRTISARLFSAYGEGLRRQVMWDVCRKAHSGEKVRLQGTGEETRDFLHAKDIAAGLEAIAENAENAEMDGGACNLASGEETRIADLADILMKGMGRQDAPEFDGRVPEGNPLQWQADISRVRTLGFAPGVQVASGAEAYARWAKKEWDA